MNPYFCEQEIKVKSFLKKIPVVIVLILSALTVSAQNGSWELGAESGVGAIWVHRKKMKHLADTHPSKVELSFQKQTSGNKDWHKVYHKPRIGYSFIYINYGNDVLGKTYGATLQLIYPFIRTQRSRLNGVIGIGTGYNTKPFDRKENHKNNVLGSRITGCLHAKLNYEHIVTSSIGVYAGLGLIHFSNGAAKLPNLGINVPYLNIGTTIKITNAAIDKEYSSTENLQKMYQSVDVSTGWKDVVYSGGKRYMLNVLTFKNHYSLSDVNTISGGLEVFYDRSIPEFRENFDLENDKNRNLKSGLVLGHELRIGKTYAVVNYGVYLYQAYDNVYAKAYQRYQLKYKFHQNIYAAAGLKVHRGVADVIECTVGVEL